MQQIKFSLIRILINVIMVVVICRLFLYGFNTNNLFRTLPASILLCAGVIISIFNVKYKGFINALAELSVCALMYLVYVKVMEDSYDILASNYVAVGFIRGIVAATAGVILLKLVEVLFLPVLKYAEIYSLVNNTGILESLAGCLVNWGKVLFIPFFNYVIHKSFSELFNTAKDMYATVKSNVQEGERSEAAEPSKVSETVNGLLDAFKDTKVVKSSSKLLKIYANYPDECVLAYCYKHPDKSMYDSVLQSIGIFIKNAPVLIGQIAAIVLMNTIFRIVLILATVLIIKNYGVFSVTNCFLYFFLIYAVQFIFCDSILESLMMSSIVQTFLNKAEYDTNNYAKEVSEFMPKLNWIKRALGLPADYSSDGNAASANPVQNIGNGGDPLNNTEINENVDENTII